MLDAATLQVRYQLLASCTADRECNDNMRCSLLSSDASKKCRVRPRPLRPLHVLPIVLDLQLGPICWRRVALADYQQLRGSQL